jgi:sensor domain CHASE-containing protein
MGRTLRKTLGAARLQTKTSLTLFLTSLVLVAVLIALSKVVTVSGFSRLEERESLNTLARLKGTFDDRVAALHVKSSDWANWDDTWQFIADHNEAYVESNLQDSALVMLEIDAMVLVDTSREVVFARSVDLQTGQQSPMPPGLINYLATSTLGYYDNPTGEHSGVIVVVGQPMIVSSRPILKSNGDGPVQGALIFVQTVDARFIDSLAQSQSMVLSWAPYRFSDVFGAGSIAGDPSSEAPHTVKISDRNSMTGEILLADLFGNPAFILKSDMPRPIYSFGQSVVKSYNLADRKSVV